MNARFAVLLISMILLISCEPVADKNGTQTSPPSLPEVSVMTLEPSEIRPTRMLSGMIESRFDLEIASEIDGVVTAHPHPVGSEVAHDAIVMQIESQSWRLERDRAAVLVEEAQIDAGISAETRRRRIVDLALAEDRLQRAAIRAPRIGRIERIDIEVGEFVTRGQVVLRLVDHSTLRIRARIGAELALALDNGANAHFRVRGLGEQVFPLTLKHVTRAADPSDGLFEVEFDVSAHEGLRPGLIAEVTVSAAKGARGILIPTKAVFRRFAESFCFIAVENKDGEIMAVEQRVRLAPLAGDATQRRVIDGLSEGDRLVLGPLVGISDQSAVTIRFEGKRQ